MTPIHDRYCYAAFGTCRGCGAMATTNFDHSKPDKAITVLIAKIASWEAYTDGAGVWM